MFPTEAARSRVWIGAVLPETPAAVEMQVAKVCPAQVVVAGAVMVAAVVVVAVAAVAAAGEGDNYG